VTIAGLLWSTKLFKTILTSPPSISWGPLNASATLCSLETISHAAFLPLGSWFSHQLNVAPIFATVLTSIFRQCLKRWKTLLTTNSRCKKTLWWPQLQRKTKIWVSSSTGSTKKSEKAHTSLIGRRKNAPYSRRSRRKSSNNSSTTFSTVEPSGSIFATILRHTRRWRKHASSRTEEVLKRPMIQWPLSRKRWTPTQMNSRQGSLLTVKNSDWI